MFSSILLVHFLEESVFVRQVGKLDIFKVFLMARPVSLPPVHAEAATQQTLGKHPNVKTHNTSQKKSNGNITEISWIGNLEIFPIRNRSDHARNINLKMSM